MSEERINITVTKSPHKCSRCGERIEKGEQAVLVQKFPEPYHYDHLRCSPEGQARLERLRAYAKKE